MRGISAGIVWTLLILMFPKGYAGTKSMLLATPIIWPVAVVFMFAPASLFFSLVGKFFLPAHLMRIWFTFLGVSVGDPLIWLLSRFKPEWVPMHKPPFMSQVLLWGIYDANEVTVADETGVLSLLDKMKG